MRKRKHTDTSRVTARERVESLQEWAEKNFDAETLFRMPTFWVAIERAMQAHARQALVRARLRSTPYE